MTADFKKLTNETPDITTITYENAFKTVNKAFEFLDIPFRDSEPLQKSLVPEKNDINMQLLPPAKEKDMASPLKPLNVFPPLETLKEEESIIEEKSSEYPLNESGNCRNIQILESFSNSKEVLPKKLCIKCCRCSGTGIDPNSPKKGKACSKCVKGFVKVNKKMLKLINHVLTYKLSTKFKKLLELNNEIGKGVISIFDKDIKLKSHENIEKIDELKNQELESFVCQACSGEFGPSEIRYKSIEGDLELCEKCENECFVSQNFIKLKPPSRRQGTNSSSSSN